MRELIEFVGMMRDVYGSFSEARRAARDLYDEGRSALSGHGDEYSLLQDRAEELGIINSSGQPQIGECAGLIYLCDNLANLPEPASKKSSEPEHLLFTVPENQGTNVEPNQRLDLYILRLIRMSTETVKLGGPFWNEEGLDQIFEVLTPALNKRDVDCSFYFHYEEDNEILNSLLERIQTQLPKDKVTIWWYTGPKKSLMHAKFVLRDEKKGYLGSANLTSLGLGHHLEIGVPLNEIQCKELLDLLNNAKDEELFLQSSSPPNHHQIEGN